jgi:hypothetical protein
VTKPSKAQMAEKRRTHLWVIWEALRRNPSYRKAVADFLKEVRAQLRQRRRQLAVAEDSLDLEFDIRACQTVLCCGLIEMDTGISVV